MGYLNKAKKAFRFVISGGTAASVSLVLFYVFWNVLHIWYLLASVLSFMLSVVVGFYLQKHFTFKDASKGSTRKQVIVFLLVSIFNLLINIILMAFFVELLSVDEMLSKVITLAILSIWNFFVYKKFVFKVKV